MRWLVVLLAMGCTRGEPAPKPAPRAWIPWLAAFEAAKCEVDEQRALGLALQEARSEVPRRMREQAASCLASMGEPDCSDCFFSLTTHARAHEQSKLVRLADQIGSSSRLRAQRQALEHQVDSQFWFRYERAAARAKLVTGLKLYKWHVLAASAYGVFLLLMWLLAGRDYRKRENAGLARGHSWYLTCLYVLGIGAGIACFFLSPWISAAGIVATFFIGSERAQTFGAAITVALIAAFYVYSMVVKPSTDCSACDKSSVGVVTGRVAEQQYKGRRDRIEYRFLENNLTARATVDSRLWFADKVRLRYNSKDPLEHELVDNQLATENLTKIAVVLLLAFFMLSIGRSRVVSAVMLVLALIAHGWILVYFKEYAYRGFYFWVLTSVIACVLVFVVAALFYERQHPNEY